MFVEGFLVPYRCRCVLSLPVPLLILLLHIKYTLWTSHPELPGKLQYRFVFPFPSRCWIVESSKWNSLRMEASCLSHARITTFTFIKTRNLDSSFWTPIVVSFLQPFFSSATRSIRLDSLLTRLFLSGPASCVMCAELTTGDVSTLNLPSQQIAVPFTSTFFRLRVCTEFSWKMPQN